MKRTIPRTFVVVLAATTKHRSAAAINTALPFRWMATWANAAGADLEIYWNNVKIATAPDTGKYTDIIGLRGRGTYTDQVCEAGTRACSNEATVVFN